MLSAHMFVRRALPALLIALSAGAHAADPPAAKCDTWLRSALSSPNPSGRLKVVARLGQGSRAAQEAALRRLGADIYRRLPLVDSVALSVPSRRLASLARLPFVERLSCDVRIARSDAFTVEHSLTAQAWGNFGVNGAGVTVVVMDSGVDSHHPDISGRVSQLVSFVSGQTADPIDRVGHGTHIAGIVAGNGASSSGGGTYQTFKGIAPRANLVSVRVLDRSGGGNVSDALAGMQWVYDNRGSLKIRVLNVSFGHGVGESYATDPLCQAVEKLWKAGVVVVCAAGNDGRLSSLPAPGQSNGGYGARYGSIQSPGNDPYVITVGAMKRTSGGRGGDTVATYSSRGPSRLDFVLKPDIVAPGNKIISLMASDGHLVRSIDNRVMRSEYVVGAGSVDISTSYLRLSGTSMATPVVSGAVALLLQRHPSLSPDTVKARLMLTADKWLAPDGSADPCAFGAGLLNVNAALASNALANRYALSPTLAWYSDGTVRISTSGLVDPNQVIWGVSGVTNLRTIWGNQVIWGTSTNILSGSQVLWGTSVWMDQVIWGTSTTSIDLTSIGLIGE